MPEFFRIQNEAEMFAPHGYRRLYDEIVASYVRVLKPGVDPRDPEGFSDQELEVVAHMLLGARACLGKRYGNPEGDAPVPDHVFSAYAKLMRRGLFPRAETAPPQEVAPPS
jgi:hypothetical protein